MQLDAIDRRGFLQTTAAAAGIAAIPSAAAVAVQQPDAKDLPRRKLGKTGAEVTILNFGSYSNPGVDRMIRLAYAQGVRMFDTAHSYGSEPGFKRWFEAMPEVRKSIFLVTKDTPRAPKEMLTMVDDRLKALGVDQIDLFFVHALGDDGVKKGLEWPKSKEVAQVVDQLKASGKIRFFGFSSHHERRAEYLQAAAEGGFIDAIMLQYTPWLDKDSALNKALDACHSKNIGLISMKQVAGQFGAGNNGAREDAPILQQVVERVKALKERNLTPFQGLLHAIWTDERIAACCVSMRNNDQVRENADAARRYEPVKTADLIELRDESRAAGPMLCADCDGRCAVAAGTTARLGDLTRYLTYHQHHGDRDRARRDYAALTNAERDWTAADLEAARQACPNRLDFATLLPKVNRHLA